MVNFLILFRKRALTHLPMFLPIWAMKNVSDRYMIPLLTASWSFPSKDWSWCCSFFMRFCGQVTCMILQIHITPPRRMDPSLTKFCRIMDRITIPTADVIAWWYSWRVENMAVGERVLEESPFHWIFVSRPAKYIVIVYASACTAFLSKRAA